MVEPYDLRTELRGAFKLTLRALLFTGAGAVLWHAPVETLWVRIPLGAGAVFLLYLAFIVGLVAAGVCRNILATLFGLAGRRMAIHALSAICLALIAGTSVGVFVLIGRSIGA